MDLLKLRKELIRDEALRLTVYRDSVDLYTIGVGHELGATPRMTVITNEEAMALLTWDIEVAIGGATALLGSVAFNALSDARQRALTNMCFNLGHRIWEFGKFITALNKADWPTAAAEMMDSKWAKEVGERADRLHAMILTGQDPA